MDASAISVTASAEEVPSAATGGIIDAGEFVTILDLASLEAEVLVGNDGAVGPLFAHGVVVAGREAREQVAVSDAEGLRGVPHALIIIVTVDGSDVAEFTHFLASRSAVGEGGGGDLTLVVDCADTERTEVASHAALVLDRVPLTDVGVAVTSGSTCVASGAASLSVGFPQAVVVSGARVLIPVQVFATLGAGFVGTPVAHEDGLAARLRSDEVASLTAANITFIEHAAGIGIASGHVSVLELTLDVAGV